MRYQEADTLRCETLEQCRKQHSGLLRSKWSPHARHGYACLSFLIFVS